MVPLTQIAHALVQGVLRPGDVAIDATVGNGHDTLHLAQCVGPSGTVYGFDIQQDALLAANERLRSASLENVVLLPRSHAELPAALPESAARRVRAVMFNLGYLPGGDKSLTTQVESTLAALEASLKLIEPGGIVTIVAYVGHSAGKVEAEAVERHLAELSPTDFEVREETDARHSISAPRLFIVRKHMDAAHPKPEANAGFVQD